MEQENALPAVCSSSFIWHWDNRQHLQAVWILKCVSIWMVWSCFQNTLSKGAVRYPHPSHLLHPNARTLAHPSHCCCNGFTRCWPCSNEVWSFCVATGKLSCGTVLFILVHLLQCYTPLIYLLLLAHSVTSIGKITLSGCQKKKKKANNWETICPSSLGFAAVVLYCTNSQFNHHF